MDSLTQVPVNEALSLIAKELVATREELAAVKKAQAEQPAAGEGAASSRYNAPTVHHRYADFVERDFVERHMDMMEYPRQVRRRMLDVGDPHDTQGLTFVRHMKAVATSKAFGIPAADYAKRMYGSDKRLMALHTEGRAFDVLTRALTVGDPAAGGAFTPDDFLAELIPLLRTVAVVRMAGATVLPVPRGNISIPKQTGAGTAYWEGEQQNVTESTQATGQMRLDVRRLTALTATSKDLLLSSSIAVDQFIRNDLLYQMALAEDLAFLLGDGTAGSPIGMYNMTGIQSLVVGTNGAQPDGDIPGKVIQLAEAQNARMIAPVWFFNSRTKLGFRNVRTSTNQYIFRDEMKEGTLEGYPFHRTEQIGNAYTQGSATTASIALFADAAELVIGEQGDVEVEASTEAPYVSGGNVVSAFTRSEMVIKVERRVDFNCRQPATIVRAQGLLSL